MTRFLAAVLATLLLVAPARAGVVSDFVRDYNPSVPMIGVPFALGVPGCAATGLMIASARRGGVKSRVAYQIVGGCFVPFVGGWVVKHFTDQHPEWDEIRHPSTRRVD